MYVSICALFFRSCVDLGNITFSECQYNHHVVTAMVPMPSMDFCCTLYAFIWVIILILWILIKEPELQGIVMFVDGAGPLMGPWAPRKEAGWDVKKAAQCPWANESSLAPWNPGPVHIKNIGTFRHLFHCFIRYYFHRWTRERMKAKCSKYSSSQEPGFEPVVQCVKPRMWPL